MKSLTVSTNGGLLIFSLNDVVRLQASSNYTYIHLVNNKKILSTKVLHIFEAALLSEGFIRLHNSHLVNKHFVKSVAPDGNVCLHDDTIIHIARRRKKDVIKQLKEILSDDTIAA